MRTLISGPPKRLAVTMQRIDGDGCRRQTHIGPVKPQFSQVELREVRKSPWRREQPDCDRKTILILAMVRRNAQFVLHTIGSAAFRNFR